MIRGLVLVSRKRVNAIGNVYLPDFPGAAVTDVTSTTVTIDVISGNRCAGAQYGAGAEYADSAHGIAAGWRGVPSFE